MTASANSMHAILRTRTAPDLAAGPAAPEWAAAPALHLGYAHPRGSPHRPRATVRQLWNNTGIYTLFEVADRYVRSIHTDLNDPVCRDSCVEFFVQPQAHRGYMNLEINCGTALHASWIEDWRRTPDGFATWRRIDPPAAARIRIHGNLPRIVEPEIEAPVDWWIAFHLPFDVLAGFAGDCAYPQPGAGWRAGYFKCADACSHPHWLSWMPLEELNFHRPDRFGMIVFQGDSR